MPSLLTRSRGPVPMRELIATYEAACKDVLGRAGWRRRTGGMFTLDLGDGGCFAWLGRNTATKYHPLTVNPVVGIRHEALQKVLRALLPARSGPNYVTATLAVPVGYLTPANKYLTLTVSTADEALDAAVETEQLARTYGVPLAQRLAPLDALLREFQNHTLPSVNRGEYEVPVLLAMLNRPEEARQAVERLRQDPDRHGLVGEQDEHFAASFTAWLDQG